MEKWGNNNVNAIFEGNLPNNFRRPSDSGPVSELKRFIRDKYEYRKFKVDESAVPKQQANNNNNDSGFGGGNSAPQQQQQQQQQKQQP